MSKVPLTTQFKSLATPNGKKAYDAYVACFFNGEHEMFIGAPTLEDLIVIFPKHTGNELDVEGVQHVWIVRAEK